MTNICLAPIFFLRRPKEKVDGQPNPSANEDGNALPPAWSQYLVPGLLGMKMNTYSDSVHIHG